MGRAVFGAALGHVEYVEGSSEMTVYFFFFSSRRRHTRLQGDWSSDVCSSDLCNRDQVWSRLLRTLRWLMQFSSNRLFNRYGHLCPPSRNSPFSHSIVRTFLRDRKSVV